jgi:predicted DNA-binding transcriptional regulator YafY
VRADRLVAIVLLLQVHGQLTAGELAELLETSERTIRRDLEALCVAGVPLYSSRGRGGGWALLGGNRIDLSGFTVDEARALFLMAGARGAAPGADGADSGLRSALRKLLAALPEPLREAAAAADGAMVVDPAGWGREPEASPHLETLQRAVVERVQVDIDYTKPGAATERRRAHPYGLVAKRGVWYLLAGTPAGRRTFRLSRMAGVEPTGEPATVPADLDLAGEWESVQRDYLRRMQVVEVELEVAASAVLRLSASLRGWASAEDRGEAAAGRRRVVAAFPHVGAAAGHLAGFGGDVRVVAPAELRDQLRRLGEGLVEANS